MYACIVMAKKVTNIAKKNNNKCIDGLRQMVAESYALMGLTHLCHWNVEGPGFFALHTAFEEQYTELFQAIDELAERLRALGAYAPGGLDTLAKMANLPAMKENASASTMIKALLEAHGRVVRTAAKTRDAAADIGDKETEDMMIGRIQIHEKTTWMLASYLRG